MSIDARHWARVTIAVDRLATQLFPDDPAAAECLKNKLLNLEYLRTDAETSRKVETVVR